MGSVVQGINPDIINKYQDVAPRHVIRAVEKASARTGVDFAFLMEKAAAESSFNPKAKARNSSATGLFQFIEQTWLRMVKQHGGKYGLGAYADKIEIKNGKACVSDCDVKDAILDLRKNPEISALMAGEYSAQNKEFLEDRVSCDVGSTELYLAHFMGAGGAAKFLNCKDVNGDAVAAGLFPKAARANKNLFFDQDTGRALTLNEIYARFDQKFTGGTDTAQKPGAPPSTPVSTRAPDAAPLLTPLDLAAQALPSFDDADESDDIIWNDDPRFKTGFSAARTGAQKLSPASILMISEMQQHMAHIKESRRYNS